jgi:hypothetical protein
LKTITYTGSRLQVRIATCKRLSAPIQKPHLPRRYVNVYTARMQAGFDTIFLTWMYFYFYRPFLKIIRFPPPMRNHVNCRNVSQYSETNVMQFLLDLLRIKSLYTFRALLAHPQEALNKWHLAHCVRVISVGCTILDGATKCRLRRATWGWTSNARNV